MTPRGLEFQWKTSYSIYSLSNNRSGAAIARPFTHTLISTLLAVYLLAGILGPSAVFSTFINSGSSIPRLEQDDGLARCVITVASPRRHIIPEFRTVVFLPSQAVVLHADPQHPPQIDYSDIASRLLSTRLSTERPRDPPPAA